MAREEVAELEARETQLIEDLKVSLIPRDPNDDRNVIVEIRAGAGGEEAALFAAELLRMYSRYAQEHRFRTDLMSLNETGIGGIKEAILEVAGDGAYSRLKFEGGVHRVQRVPSTESSGRIHTSTATVIVLPEVDEVEVEIDETRDLRIDVKRASGPGGQSVNTTDSAVRITHLPTGLVVEIQDEKSQHKNKAKALAVLRSRLYDLELAKQREEQSAERRTMVQAGDRSEKIRTYNFPDNRVTDHRIGTTIHNVPGVLEGQLDPLIDALVMADQADRLRNLTESDDEPERRRPGSILSPRAPGRSGMPDTAPSVSELVRRAAERLAAAGIESAAAGRRAADGVRAGRRPGRRPGTPGRAGPGRGLRRVRGVRRPPGARRARGLHPRLPRVPRPGHRHGPARAHPAARDRAPRGRGDRGRGRAGSRPRPGPRTPHRCAWPTSGRGRGRSPWRSSRPCAGGAWTSTSTVVAVDISARGARPGPRERRGPRRGRPDALPRGRPAHHRRHALRGDLREPPVRGDGGVGRAREGPRVRAAPGARRWPRRAGRDPPAAGPAAEGARARRHRPAGDRLRPGGFRARRGGRAAAGLALRRAGRPCRAAATRAHRATRRRRLRRAGEGPSSARRGPSPRSRSGCWPSTSTGRWSATTCSSRTGWWRRSARRCGAA